MALLPPRVIGPLSECSSGVRVQSQLTGSTVTIFADGAVVGSGTASWSDQIFTLSAPLAAGQQVTATQSVGWTRVRPRPSPSRCRPSPPSSRPWAFAAT
jgi:hypothetical protein